MDPTLFYYFCRICMVLGYALAIMDAFSTIAALAYGGKEANPIWEWFMGVLGPYWCIPRILLAQGIVWVNVNNATAPFVWYVIPAAILPIMLLGYVVQSNFRIAYRLRRAARAQYR